MHRSLIEQPLVDELAKRFPRMRQVGSGSLLDSDYRLRRADFAFTAPRKDQALAAASLVDLLRGVPRGSRVLVNGAPRDVGTLSGLTVVLPPVEGVDYEDDQHVLHTHAVDRVVQDIRAAVPQALVSWQFTAIATDIHVHGPGDLRSAVAAVLDANPYTARAEFDEFSPARK
ncbi:hypothetical protein [Schumannella luteola]